MTIPSGEECLAPLVRFLKEDRYCDPYAYLDYVAKELSVSEEERNVWDETGKRTKFANINAFALAGLNGNCNGTKTAKFVEKKRPGVYRLNALGATLKKRNEKSLKFADLKAYPRNVRATED